MLLYLNCVTPNKGHGTNSDCNIISNAVNIHSYCFLESENKGR